MRKSRPEEADLHISVLGVVPGGPWWRNITARGCEVSAAARGLSEACLLGPPLPPCVLGDEAAPPHLV